MDESYIKVYNDTEAWDVQDFTQVGSYLKGINTDRATNYFGETAGEVYRYGKNLLPYLGTKGVAAHTVLTAAETAFEGYLRYNESTTEQLVHNAGLYLDVLE